MRTDGRRSRGGCCAGWRRKWRTWLGWTGGPASSVSSANSTSDSTTHPLPPLRRIPPLLPPLWTLPHPLLPMPVPLRRLLLPPLRVSLQPPRDPHPLPPPATPTGPSRRPTISDIVPWWGRLYTSSSRVLPPFTRSINKQTHGKTHGNSRYIVKPMNPYTPRGHSDDSRLFHQSSYRSSRLFIILHLLPCSVIPRID